MDEPDLHSLSFCNFKILFLFYVGFSLLLTPHRCSSASVTGVWPHSGSLAGETRLTISGSGFSGNQFSDNDDPNVGDSVTLVSSSREIPCETHKDGTTELQIMCYTPEGMPEDDYYVKVKVNGVAVSNANLCNNNPTSDNCRYRPKPDNTPTIATMSAQSGEPGNFVTLEGKLYSDRYGSNLAASTNNRLEKLLRVYVGPQDCELKNGDDFYGLSLNSDSTDHGSLKCKTKGTSVGFFNASFIVESPFGRSLPVSTLYRVSYNDKIHMYQTYTDITSITPNTGSTEGGLILTIYGNHFDDRRPYSDATVSIDNTVCSVTSVVVNSHILCTVAADPQSGASYFPGNRGVDFEYWTSTSKSIDDISDVLSFTPSTSGYVSRHLDETYYTDVNDTMDTYVSRMTAYFHPPHDGYYQFMLDADDGAKLYIDGVEAASSAGSTGYSTKRSLSKSQRYLLKVVHFENTGASYIRLQAKFSQTKFKASMTGNAVQEQQTIRVTSTVVKDVQELTFSNFASQTATNEVQRVTVDTQGDFRFGLFGVYTEPLTLSMSDEQLTTAMSSLPCLTSETIDVARQSEDTPTYLLTFNSRRGNFPDVTVVTVANQSALTYTVSKVTPGVPDKNTVALMMQGVVSPSFTVDVLSSPTLETVLNSMFGAQCPAMLENPQPKWSFESFESSGSYTGHRVKDTDAFCGQYSLKNPWKVYQIGDKEPGIQLSQHRMICFAYKGVLSDRVWMKYSYIDASSNERVTRTDSWAKSFEKDASDKSTTWYYTCIDMLTLAGHTLDSDHRMEWVYIRQGSGDIFIDAVYIGPEATTTDIDEINLRRLPASRPNGALIDSVSVTSTSANVFRVSINPYNCADEFPLFELANGQVSDGSTANSSNAATLELFGGGTASIAVARTSTASPPVTGTIDVTYDGEQKRGLNISLDADPFKKDLMSLADIGDLSVEKVGTCANFDLRVTFLTLAGDLPQMTVNDTGLNGINARAAVSTNQDGGLFYNPLTGDMTSTVHTSPQVRATINGVPTLCRGNCAFSWASEATPTVTDITPDQGTSALSTSVVIDGTGFDTTPNNNVVTIGGVACTITASTATSITCNVGNGPVGSHKVIVNVTGKGLALHPVPNVTFSYVAAIQNINPTSGSLGGGNILTITGYGLKASATVAIGGTSCAVLSGTPSKITCRIPLTSTAGQVDVIVTQGSTTLSHSGYNYDNSMTPRVTGVSPTSMGVKGGTITIDGSNLGSSGVVFIGSVQATVSSFTSSQVVVNVSSIDAGSHQVKVDSGRGYALTGTGSLPTITAVLQITNVFPTTGSLHGGTQLTISGNGFGTSSGEVSVTVGTHSCDISSIVDTEVRCQIADTAVVHQVTNRGSDPAFGVFYAFDKPHLTIEVGDFVRWSWQTPEFVNDIAHAIIQVASSSATTPLSGGFSSGTPSKNGHFQYRFTQTGTYYVWSGYVDIYQLKNYAGTINVIDKSSRAAVIDLSLAGKSAQHNVGGADNPVDSSNCGSQTSSVSGCSSVSQPSGSDAAKFYFAFWTCSTPVVSSLTPRKGTTLTDITITGSGFSSASCQNEVKLGAGHSCTVKSSSSTSLTCNVDSSSEPEVALLHEVSLRVGNRGYALMNIMNPTDRTFGVIPNIVTVSPYGGSLEGGALLTVTGSGFDSPVSVTVNGYSCTVANISYTQILCSTPSSTSQGEKTVAVVRTINGASQPATCENGNCIHSYVSTYTPTLTSVSPSSVSGATNLTIRGTKFGNSTAALTVAIGGVQATVSSAQNTVIEVTVQNLPAGNNDVVVTLGDYGKAQGALTVTGVGLISSVVPSSGSIHGKTLVTISGNGFLDTATTVTIDSVTCDLQSVTLSEVTCITRAHADEAVNLVVTSNNVQYTPKTYTYDTASTPTITSISPTQGEAGDTLTITGTNFDPSVDSVVLDNVPCVVGQTSGTQITCVLGPHATGSTPVHVFVNGKGASNSNVDFEYELSVSSITPSTGGIAGGQTVSLVGVGFDISTAVTICDQPCVFKETTVNLYKCKTPAVSAQACNVIVNTNGLSATLSSAYTYNAALTPSITSVTPTRGGTGGGTTITVSGSGFGTTSGDASVTIDGAACSVTEITNTVLKCVTSSHSGSIQTKVDVEIAGNGVAQESTSGASNFYYIDLWSSSFTWGGGPVPAAGEFVVVPAGQTLLLDTDTPVLAFLLIQGGMLIFDDKDIELQANYIMITDGGVLQVGTEDAPFQRKAIITLHGHHRSKELPIYGTKVLAVRNGTLDLHGMEIPITWTRLASTAARNSNTLTLTDPVDWKVGDEIVIASTGHHHSQSENEKKNISAISSDKRTLTLSTPLEAEHLGTSETFDGTEVEFRAEVGLLTHNVVVRGNRDPQWTEEIKACPDGFNTGEFATQTCFQGRFGDEIGSSQFGGMILVHCPVMDSQCAKAKLSYIEVTFGGQAFRLGRYPIHFHLNGDMSSSYVRGCGIHETFNRAVNIHGSHNTLVEKTVIYNIMGGAFFLEDGIETNNTIQYNLAVFVRESSSLLNDDVTPASFWVTNPDNIIQHNAAAGGSHFGFWYRMHNHPDGPSFTESVCPKNVPLGVFNNNTAHSFGWFGLWIFEDYFPLQGGCGGTAVQPAVFQGLTAWNCDKGAEAVNSGALQFENFVLVQNRKAGYEGKKILNVPLYTDDGPMVKDSLIVGTTTVAPSSVQGNTDGGIVMPYGAGFQVKNVRFVNFAVGNSAAFSFARIAGTCSDQCGGYNYHCTGLKFVNANNRVFYAWDWEGILIDMDGSLTGSTAGSSVVTDSGTVPSDCSVNPWFSVGVNGSVCPPGYKWHRFAFNNIQPSSLEAKNFLITNQYGTSTVPFRDKRLSHKPGWMCALVDGETYEFEFENADQITNISFTGGFENFGSADYVFVKQAVSTFPDRFSIDGGKNFINATVSGIDPATAKNGDWEWDNANNKIKTIVHGRQRSRRGMSTYSVDRSWSFSAFKCYYTDCIPPPDPNTVPPADSRSAVFEYWHDVTLWNNSGDYLINEGGSTGVPVDYDNVRIKYGKWVRVNGTIAKLGILLLEGVLEFDDYPAANYEINADCIIIKGGRLIIGWPNDPFDGLASIILRGNHSSPNCPSTSGPAVGSKAIGVFGGLDLFGKDPGVVWTKLSATANRLDTQITLKDNVTWDVGSEIVIGPTGYNAWETETRKITAVSNNGHTLTLNQSLSYRHVSYMETLGTGEVIDLAAAVGLFTRNIKIIGEDYIDLYPESFGARVLVGLTVDEGQVYTGYARLSNVEFYHTGQEGWTEPYDPRFSVAYVATGTVSNVKPSFVSRCAFHDGFSSAVGAFGIGSLNVTENVIHHTVGNAIDTSSDDTRIEGNLVALVVWTGAYQDRQESFNIRFEAGINAIEANRLILNNNVVTGSERLGYHVPGEACSGTATYTNNAAYSNLVGVATFPEDELDGCGKYSGFTVWKSHDYGIYCNNAQSLMFENNLLVENRVGLFPMVVGPSSTAHIIGNKTIEVSDSVFVGATSSMDCALDVSPANDDNILLSPQARPGLGVNGQRLAILFPQCTAGSNSAPKKPWAGIMSYNSITCYMILKDSTFAHFGSKCNGDFMIATNSKNDDLQHPLHVRGLTLEDSAAESKLFYHRPNVGKINSADCVDMDCDALKKALLKDEDGSFLDHVGAVFSQSEYEWGVNPRRGLGDYRIPKELLTDINGNKLDVNVVAPNKGIIRNDGCVFHLEWQAWECMADMNHEMMVIESMDPDTETRRLSPVAVLGDRYIDLINGPQDHGWCSGYTCRKRLSTFHAVVATGKPYAIYFTSTAPLKSRYMLLNVDSTKSVRLSVWYSRPNRLDVYVNKQFIISSNARIDSQGQYIVSMLKGDEFMPTHNNATGTNFVDRDKGMIHFLLKGPDPVEIRTIDVIIVSFGIPALTVDSFFGDNIIENLAAFLNIPLTKVRVVSVTSASGASGRRRRSVGVNVEIEIGNEPAADDNTTISDNLDLNQLTELATELVNDCQVGNISATLNVTTSGCTSVEVPTSSASEGVITYSTPQPDRLVFSSTPVPEYEGVPLSVQPILQAVDQSDVIVTELGTIPSPWQMTASIRSGTGHSDATLSGTMTVNATNGWFNFTDLAISHMGTGYVLDFNITYPAVAENFSIASSPFNVSGRPLTAYVVSKTTGDIVQSSRFTVTLGLKDSTTGEIISDIDWRNHTWNATAQIIGSPNYATMSGFLAMDFDPISGTVMFPDLNITGFGFFYIQFTVMSNPTEFSFTMNEKIEILNPLHVGMTIEETYEIAVKFDMPYDTVITSDDKKAEFEQMMLQEYASQFPSVRLTKGTVSRGSIVVTFTVAGSTADVNSTAYTMCETVLNATSYTFGGLSLTLYPSMTVNNQSFYGVNCGTSNTVSSSEGLHPGVIAAIAIIAFLVVAGIIVLVVWKCFIRPNNRTGHMPRGLQYLGNSNEKTQEILFRENTFTSMKFNMEASGMAPPVATSMGSLSPQNKQLRLHGASPFVSSLSPEPIHIAKQGARTPSPSRSVRSVSPMPQRHSPFDAGGSPLPPVGLYTGEYITSPMPRENTVVFPEPVVKVISPPPVYRE